MFAQQSTNEGYHSKTYETGFYVGKGGDLQRFFTEQTHKISEHKNAGEKITSSLVGEHSLNSGKRAPDKNARVSFSTASQHSQTTQKIANNNDGMLGSLLGEISIEHIWAPAIALASNGFIPNGVLPAWAPQAFSSANIHAFVQVADEWMVEQAKKGQKQGGLQPVLGDTPCRIEDQRQTLYRKAGHPAPSYF
jgi:hypothetical protein